MECLLGKKIQICVFAYNLAQSIEKNLSSLMDSCAEYKVEIFVLVNGCRDDTLGIVSRMSLTNKNIHPIYIELGDKSNAWNTFVFEYYTPNSIAIFADGDLRFAKNAVKNLLDYHSAHLSYKAISSFPFKEGRSSKKWRYDLLKEHQFTGNLYLLSPSFLAKILQCKIKLPVGLIGDDSMLGFLSATDLCSGTDLPKERIGVCQDAVFIYESLDPLKWKHCKLYLRRRVRYSLRYFQQKSIVSKLKKEGIGAMPMLAIEQTNIPWNEIRWFSSHLVFDLAAKLMVNKAFSQMQAQSYSQIDIK